MSYVRWSSDNYKSDLYCYMGADGFRTHVAGRRRIGIEGLGADPINRLMQVNFDNKAEAAAFAKERSEWMDRLDALPMVPIGLPHDGQTIISHSLPEMLKVVLMLQAEGYYVPHWLVPDLCKEIADEEAAA